MTADSQPTTQAAATGTGPEAAAPAPGRLERALGAVPRVLASKGHILLLAALGVYLVVLPATGVFSPSAQQMLIGGNYTNVTSDLGACIAAGGTLKLVSGERKRSRLEAERLRLAAETHRLLHHVHSTAARELGQAPTPPEV